MYGEYIANFGPVLNVSVPSDIISMSERDPRSVALESRVTSKMNEAINQSMPKKLPEPVNKIRVVSYEDAMKELALFKSSNDKS